MSLPGLIGAIQSPGRRLLDRPDQAGRWLWQGQPERTLC